MTKRYSIADARARLPAIVDQALAGHPVELTRRGVPVAVVISRRENSRLQTSRRHFAGAYREFLARFDLAEVGVARSDFADLRSRQPSRGIDR